MTKAVAWWARPSGFAASGSPKDEVDAAKKYVVSSTLDRVDWNAELVRGDV